MASISVLCVFVVLGLHVGSTKSFIKVNCNSKVNGQYGQASVLDCTISTSVEVINPKITGLLWLKEGEDDPLLYYKDSDLKPRPGYSFAHQDWNKSFDVSLRIQKTTLQHEGDYICEVMMNSGWAKGQSSLNVIAKYSQPTITSKPEKLTRSTGGHLECSTSSGFPKGQIRWFGGESKEVTERATMKQTQTEEGLFQLSSRLMVQERSNFSNFSCVVFNASGGRERETTFEFVPEPEGQGQPTEPSPRQLHVVAPLVVIGSCIVGLLLVLVYRRKRQCLLDRAVAPRPGSYDDYEEEPAKDHQSIEPLKTEDV